MELLAELQAAKLEAKLTLTAEELTAGLQAELTAEELKAKVEAELTLTAEELTAELQTAMLEVVLMMALL